MSSYFAVQSYKKGNKGVLIEEVPQVVASEAAAVRRAEVLARRRAGAVAFMRVANDFDEFDDPKFLARFGEVPDDVIEAMLIPA
ncbi:hypothetical protein [Devosia sp. 2618]|uniref:hypothetical protein n=1 Tax=Devosia sp. 2618 TaxID=3156454 RepID=UPI0033915BBD